MTVSVCHQHRHAVSGCVSVLTVVGRQCIVRTVSALTPSLVEHRTVRYRRTGTWRWRTNRLLASAQVRFEPFDRHASDAIRGVQPAPAKYCKDRGSLVYIQSTPPSATSVTHPSGYRLSHASFRCPQPQHLHGHWYVNEVARFKYSSCLYCDSASTSENSSLSSAFRSSVTCFVPRSAAVGLW